MDLAPNIPTKPTVTILMGVYNGARHLPAQLGSIAGQSVPDWHLVCSDDGSADESLKMLEVFAREHPGKVSILKGPQKGFSANYMALIAGLNPDCGYVCFADQDDIWLNDKLARSLDALSSHSVKPALSCGRHLYWYPERGQLTPSPRLTRPFSLRNALIENVASGNTVMLNPAAAALANKAAQRTGNVFAHDWWLYLLVTGTGGTVIFDNDPPTILYRQHGDNNIGAGRSAKTQILRKFGVLRGLFSGRIDANIAALAAIEDLLTPEARGICREFNTARQRKGISRLTKLRRIRPYRQKRAATLGFWGAATLGRI
ncbi:Glycosyl transferase, group 2 family protein [Sulfitobacter noctilucae]|uniref:glycosyltransferase n=1 Tax=Sulfitobacter noctilucae TaxID=1342302 RepID=UPI0009DE6324|nr:glycosyltransferase [Sulfitobacter noctilucae]KIN65797.1 Glycosyl transferase, group 2 family protein [Sulfitobacter noctilucae]